MCKLNQNYHCKASDFQECCFVLFLKTIKWAKNCSMMRLVKVWVPKAQFIKGNATEADSEIPWQHSVTSFHKFHKFGKQVFGFPGANGNNSLVVAQPPSSPGKWVCVKVQQCFPGLQFQSSALSSHVPLDFCVLALTILYRLLNHCHFCH